eukprot:1727424-Pleurochrysis_carterae.AAC.1
MALKPIARSSNAVMWSQRVWRVESSTYQNRPWQYPPRPGGVESVAASAYAVTMCGCGDTAARMAGIATVSGAPPCKAASASCSRM